MNDYLKELNLIDLLSEKHRKLRGEVIKLWLEKKGEEITDTETHMMAMLKVKNMTIAESGRKINLTRQAAHKCAKKLIEKGYIEMNSLEENKRDKLIVLTQKGDEYCNEMTKIKEQLEEEISANIGHENVKILKEYLRKQWLNT